MNKNANKCTEGLTESTGTFVTSKKCLSYSNIHRKKHIHTLYKLKQNEKKNRNKYFSYCKLAVAIIMIILKIKIINSITCKLIGIYPCLNQNNF